MAHTKGSGDSNYSHYILPTGELRNMPLPYLMNKNSIAEMRGTVSYMIHYLSKINFTPKEENEELTTLEKSINYKIANLKKGVQLLMEGELFPHYHPYSSNGSCAVISNKDEKIRVRVAQGEIK